MDDHEFLDSASPEARLDSAAPRVWRWWHFEDADEQYLVAATDLADLERRMRILERASGGPVFMTFNH